MTVASAELIDYASMTDGELYTFFQKVYQQKIPEVVVRWPAYSDAMDGFPSATYVNRTKTLIGIASDMNIDVSVDLHTWHSSSTHPEYMTWDTAFRSAVADCVAKRTTYLGYVRNSIDSLDGYPVKAWFVLNEPQARLADDAENQFIRDCYLTGKPHVYSARVGIRFMAGYSPTTGHYAKDIDSLTDMLCRNSYWDPRYPNTSVYGCTEAKMNGVIYQSKLLEKPLWITEFGLPYANGDAEQASYVKGWVSYSRSKSIDKIFCWASDPETEEPYNIWNGYIPRPAFYELKNEIYDVKAVFVQ